MVTGFRAVNVVPIGECELQRALTTGISLCDTDNDDKDILGRHVCEAIRKVFIVARDTINVVEVQKGVVQN